MEKLQNVLICVTRQKSCERLIKAGFDESQKSGGKPYVIHVAPIGENFLGNPREDEALECLFDISKQVGAEMTVLRSDDIVSVLKDYSEKHEIGIMILGESPKSKKEGGFIRQLRKGLHGVEFIIVPA
ncbi:MAG: universal stress protein UspA [Clostridiales bacterium]|nr:universal stress protein UspA [Clostridiales bacterium]